MDKPTYLCGLSPLLELRLPAFVRPLSGNGGIILGHEKQKHIYVGVDLYRRNHTAVIIDCWNEKLGEIEFENKPSAFDKLIQEVKKHKKKGIDPIFSLEDTGGYGRAFAVYLVEHRYTVKEVNPSLSSAERNTSAMVKKDDSWYTISCKGNIQGYG